MASFVLRRCNVGLLHSLHCPKRTNAAMLSSARVISVQMKAVGMNFRLKCDAPSRKMSLWHKIPTRNFHTVRIPFRRYSEYVGAKDQESQKDSEIPKHHADRLQLDFEEEDLAQLLVDARSLLHEDKFKKTGVFGEEAERVMDNLVKYLCYCQCSPDNILHTLKDNPGILKIPWDSLQTVILLLEEIGLRRGQLLKALNGHTALWSADSSSIRSRLKQLRHIGFNEDLRKIIAKWPQVLTLPDKVLRNAVEALRESDFSIEEVKVIVGDNPQILSASPEDIMMRFQYVHFCMGITDGKELVHGRIFRYPLEHIRCRHILLDRMGIYKSPDKHKIDSAKNPKLQLIIDTTDKRFCRKVAAGISEADYAIFKRNLREELREADSAGGVMGSNLDDSDLDKDHEGSNRDDSDLDYDTEGSDLDSEDYSDSEEDEPKKKYRR